MHLNTFKFYKKEERERERKHVKNMILIYTDEPRTNLRTIRIFLGTHIYNIYIYI